MEHDWSWSISSLVPSATRSKRLIFHDWSLGLDVLPLPRCHAGGAPLPDWHNPTPIPFPIPIPTPTPIPIPIPIPIPTPTPITG